MTISKLSLHLSANVDGVKTELEKATAATKAFNAKVRALPEVGEKITASFGRLTQVSSAFDSMSSSASNFEKTITGLSTGIGSMVVGLQLATKVTSGLKAALLGTGIGAIVIGLGSLLQRLRESEREAADASPALEFARRHRRPAPSRVVGDALSPGWGMELAPSRLPAATSVEAVASAIGDMGPEAESTARSVSRMGETLEEASARLTAHRAHLLATASAGVLADDAFRSFSDSVDSIRGAARLEGIRREVELQRVELERVRTPIERMNAELERTGALFQRGSISAETFIRGVHSAIGATASPLEAMRGQVELITTAFRTAGAELEARRGLFFGLWGRVFRVPPLDPAPFVASLERVAGVTRGPLEEMRDRMAGIRRARDAALALVPEIPGLGRDALLRRFERRDLAAGFDAAGMRAFMDLGRGVNLDMPAGPGALEFGSAEAISAINAAARAGPTDVIERQLEVLRRMREVEAAAAEDTRRMREAVEAGLFVEFGF